MKYLIVGLGNPGAEYELTRHNIGFLALDQLAGDRDCKFEPSRLGMKTEFRFKGRGIHLVKPNTYMNLSGQAVRAAVDFYKIELDDVLIVNEAFDEKVFLSARNLPHVGICDAASVDPVVLMRFEKVLMTLPALKLIEERLS